MLVCPWCSFGSALHARASSIRNVKLPLGRQNTAKRAAGHTPGSVCGSTAAGEKEGDLDGVSGAVMASPEGGDPGKPKNVGWEEEGEAAAEKVEKVGVRVLVAYRAVLS